MDGLVVAIDQLGRALAELRTENEQLRQQVAYLAQQQAAPVEDVSA